MDINLRRISEKKKRIRKVTFKLGRAGGTESNPPAQVGR